jgi:hypothetical protein
MSEVCQAIFVCDFYALNKPSPVAVERLGLQPVRSEGP